MRQNLSNHVLMFCQHLRRKSFLIGIQETIDASRALEEVDISDEEDFRLALRLVLCSSPEQQELFDRIFHPFFRSAGKGNNTHSKIPPFDTTAQRKNGREMGDQGTLLSTNLENHSEHRVKSAGFSQQLQASLVNLEKTTTARIPPEHMQEMVSAAQHLVKQVRLKKSLRWRSGDKGSRLDFRRTVRKSLQMGGDTIQLIWRGHPYRKAEYVLLCDGSRSMARFADTMLQFAFALTQCSNNVEVFLFSTHVKRITKQLDNKRWGKPPILSFFGTEWGGGTRIGESLATFVREYGPKMLCGDTVVIIASDGLDTGSSENLRWAMSTIHRQAAGVIWLNPLLRIPGYEPTARGMQTALPYIDTFSVADDAASFRQLAKIIQLRR